MDTSENIRNDQTIYRFDTQNLDNPEALISTFYGVTGNNAEDIHNTATHTNNILLGGIDAIGVLVSNSIKSRKNDANYVAEKAEINALELTSILSKLIRGIDCAKYSLAYEAEKNANDFNVDEAMKGGAK